MMYINDDIEQTIKEQELQQAVGRYRKAAIGTDVGEVQKKKEVLVRYWNR